MENTKKIGIRPSSSVYATYRRLSYKPWFALSEFVDNSTQSYFAHRDELLSIFNQENNFKKLRIEINYNYTEDKLTIFDNAYGMEIDDFTRAIVLDKPPKDRSGRSEYGMGLKTAACWFGRRWTVETTQYGSSRVLRATIDVDRLASSHDEEIYYQEAEVSRDDHYTIITIEKLNQIIRGRTLTRIVDQLGSIYRQDLRSGEIEILWNSIPLTFEEPELYIDEDYRGNVKVWRKDFSFYVPWERNSTNLQVKGWVGIRKQGKQRDAGLVLMRRGRVIVGGPEEGYKPLEIFGQANSFRSQRLIGELYLNEWPVTQAKDGFDWNDGLEDAFIEMLAKECKEYADKAEAIRHNIIKIISKTDMEQVSEKNKSLLESEQLTSWIKEEIDSKLNTSKVEIEDKQSNDNLFKEPKEEVISSDKNEINYIPVKEFTNTDNNDQLSAEETQDMINLHNISDGPIEYSLKVGETTWMFKLFWQNQMGDSHWMGIRYPNDEEIYIYLNLLHPFFIPYTENKETLQLLHKFVISMALAEKMIRMISVSNHTVDPSDFRVYMNKVLKIISDIKEEN